MSDIETRLIRLLCEWPSDVDLETINRMTTVAELQLDSLDGMEVVMEVEEEFGLAIPDEQAEKLTTVGAAIDYLKDREAEMGVPL